MLTQSIDMANILWELYEKVSPVAFGVAMTVPLVLATIRALTSFNLTRLFELLKKFPLCKNEGGERVHGTPCTVYVYAPHCVRFPRSPERPC